MLYVVITFFLLAALLGLYLISFVLQRKNTPKGIAFTHGPLAGTGLILLIIYALLRPSASLINISIVLFLLAAFGGVILITRDLLGKSVPQWLALGHGLLAIAGFLCLIFFIFK